MGYSYLAVIEPPPGACSAVYTHLDHFIKPEERARAESKFWSLPRTMSIETPRGFLIYTMLIASTEKKTKAAMQAGLDFRNLDDSATRLAE